MNLISRYVLMRTLRSIFIVLLLFSSLLGILGYADELARRGSDDFSSYHVMIFTLMELPSEIYRYFFPFIVMVGTLVSVGGLAASSELTAIRATGMSISRLLIIIMTPAVTAIFLLFAMGEIAAPALKQQAEQYRAERLGRDVNPSFGNWYRSGDQYIRIGNFLDVDDARQVLLIDLSADNLIERTVAADQVNIGEGEWLFSEAAVTSWEGTDRESVRFGREAVDQLAVAAPLSAELIYNLASDLRVLTLPELWQRVLFLQERAVLDSVLALEFWGRLMAPLLTTALTMIGIAFVFGSIRSISMGMRIAMGVALAMVLQIAQQFFGPIGLYLGLAPWLATLIPILLALGVAVGLLRRNT